jgi:Protein of unknown function (DUF1691)
MTLHVFNNVIVPLTTWTDSTSAVLTINTAFEKTRLTYRPSVAVEMGIVFIPLAVHITSGILLRANRLKCIYPHGILASYRQKKDMLVGQSYPWLRALPTFGLSDIAASGYITAFCVLLHIVMVRYLPWKYAADASITIVTRALQKHPYIFYTFYYSLLSAGAFHILSGWGKWLKLTTIRRYIFVKNAIVSVVNFSWVAALVRIGGLDIPGMLSPQYDVMYRFIWSGF